MSTLGIFSVLQIGAVMFFLALSLAPALSLALVLAVLVFSCNKYGISLHDLASAPFH